MDSCSFFFPLPVRIAVHARWDDATRACAMWMFAEQKEAEAFAKTLVNAEAAYFAVAAARLATGTKVKSVHLQGPAIGLFINGLMAYHNDPHAGELNTDQPFCAFFAPPLTEAPGGGVLMWTDHLRHSSNVVIAHSRKQALRTLLDLPWTDDEMTPIERQVRTWNTVEDSPNAEVRINGVFASLLCGAMFYLQEKNTSAEFTLQ